MYAPISLDLGGPTPDEIAGFDSGGDHRRAARRQGGAVVLIKVTQTNDIRPCGQRLSLR
ncbi:MAG: hypothetical protein MZV63_72225 [Marinilabiliales bacterium]|nr:hypothetical protein [Marinilabiliales bacterium]